MKMEDTDEYIICCSRKDELHEAYAWILNPNLKDELEGNRSVIRIKYQNRVIFCEALYLNERDQKSVFESCSQSGNDNEKSISLNQWYRKRLGIDDKVNKKSRLSIWIPQSRLTYIWAQIRANFGHPQAVVRLATALGIEGFGLGIVGLGLGIISLQELPVVPMRLLFGLPIAIGGAAVSLIGFYLWLKRQA